MTFRSAYGLKPGSKRSALGHARGLGSTGRGTEHWYWERLTALALVPLTLWAIVSLVTGVGADHAALKVWMSMPGNMTLMILLAFFFFWHAWIAVGVVIEDYVHHEAAKTGGLIVLKFACILCGTFSTVSILKIGLGG
ncbi:MAG: succinate dehydrogenase, hydrophobic membrane anchor protein [Rhodospirillales bacterium]|jgi:succinate dehydrogenase / fumarate reductase, membrane anchor subunit|nr:succinate dehydrogenase, hydrophobic membrane anchor protein [Rhodospirillales bacterium]